jgi:hypothetical protein
MTRIRSRVPGLSTLACVLALAFAACGGGGDDKDKGNRFAERPIGKTTVEPKAGVVQKGESAAAEGEVENYVPEGEIVADSGFRPEVDGFAYENYTNDWGPENLTPASMVALFGDIVCQSGEGADCNLTPAADKWMEAENAGMDGGHCEGFSISALKLYHEVYDQEDFGAEQTIDLDIPATPTLQETIAQDFVYQGLEPLIAERVSGTPSEVLDALVEALNSGEEQYTLGVYKIDGTAGHAITPFAVEDRGDGQFAILVYDNNFPGATRAVMVDTNEDTWSYTGGTNPEDLGQRYEGTGDSQTLELDPTTPTLEQQPCPFCGEGDVEGASKGSLLPKDKQYTEVRLGGNPRNHPHLVFTDDDGNQTGIVDGKLVQELDDVEVVKTRAVQNWEGGPEPSYRLPPGQDDYTITIDGTDMERPITKGKVTLLVNGLVIEIEDIRMDRGQKDEMALPAGYGITYQTNSDSEEAPNFFVGLEEAKKSYLFSASAVGVKKGSILSVVVEQDQKVMYVDSDGTEAAGGGNPVFITSLAQIDESGDMSQWIKTVGLNAAKSEKLSFEYGESPVPGEKLPFLIQKENGDVKRVVFAKPE